MKTLVAKYAGKCAGCPEKIAVGESIKWDGQAFHIGCAPTPVAALHTDHFFHDTWTAQGVCVTCNDTPESHNSWFCKRCAGTGQFITGSVNGKPVGPGGICFRCGGKGFQTEADVKRNDYHDTHCDCWSHNC